MTISVPAYAKINLVLDIVSLREDKYHNILRFMQSVDLCDKLTVTYEAGAEKQIEISCNSPDIPTDSSNLIWKAAQAFPANGNIKVVLEKNIPMAAGLAGGSSDAAATLIALNALTGDKLSKDELKAIRAKLGADIPFCIDGGAALVEGIGDILTKTSSIPKIPIVIARKGEGMSTPLAYRMLDEKFDGFNGYIANKNALDILLSRANYNNASEVCKGLFNIFESVVEPQRTCISEIKSIMLNCGANGAMMSGSGTSVFGIFQNEGEANKAVDALRKYGAVAYLCYPK
jgi:4-diphosphocytidyl-2-C-methyl-D-erythritol kinase